MIIRYLNFMGISILPFKADAPLIIDPYAPLFFPVTSKGFKPVIGRDTQGFEGRGGCNHSKFSACEIMQMTRKFYLF